MDSFDNIEDLLKYIYDNNITSPNTFINENDIFVHRTDKLNGSKHDGIVIKKYRTIQIANNLSSLYTQYLISHEVGHIVLNHSIPNTYYDHRYTALPEEHEADLVAFTIMGLYFRDQNCTFADETAIADRLGIDHGRVNIIQEAQAFINTSIALKGDYYAV